MQEVAALRRDAEDLLTAIGADRFPDDPIVDQVLSKVDQLARDLIRLAKDPITIGVVGEFSVGKSMLVGTLLGKPDLLPVHKRPATGNVTALRLEPGEQGQPTERSEHATVHFLSRQQLIECVADMVGALAEHAAKTGVDVGPLRDYNPVTDGWERLEHWCLAHLWPQKGNYLGNLEQRKIAHELLVLRDGHLSAISVLGKPVTIAHQLVAKSALDLGDTEELPRALPPRAVLPGLTEDDMRHDPAALRVAFPLIRRVEYTVKVDPSVWPLTGLRDRNAVVLLDFPGLTANRSAHRDEYLSRIELRDIHTVLTVYNSGRPGNDVPHKFYTMLEVHDRDAAELYDTILAVGNAFDRLAPPTIDETTALTRGRLLDASQDLAQLVHSAAGLVQSNHDRIRVVSSVVAIEREGYAPVFGDEEEARGLNEARVDALKKAEGWAQIGRQLALGDPAEPWAAIVGDFAVDGGFASLRRLIEEHARTHGVENKLRNLRRIRRLIDERLPQLEALLGAETLADDESSRAVQLLTALFDDFRARRTHVADSAKRFQDPYQMTVGDRSVIDAAREDALVRVSRWPHWRAIVRRAEGGYIQQSTERKQVGWSPLKREADAKASDDGDTTALFAADYRTAFVEAAKAARVSFLKALASWVAEQNVELSPIRDRLGEPEVTGLLALADPRLRELDVETDQEVRAYASDLSWLPKQLEEACRTPRWTPRRGRTRRSHCRPSTPCRGTRTYRCPPTTSSSGWPATRCTCSGCAVSWRTRSPTASAPGWPRTSGGSRRSSRRSGGTSTRCWQRPTRYARRSRRHVRRAVTPAGRRDTGRW
ncbi:dynamin family protein [Phytohabitans flavus]|uniref:dynamin family protein n=1 Tax=Phytohabitans flavus TaxID=1076124 RepID=UPI00363522D7